MLISEEDRIEIERLLSLKTSKVGDSKSCIRIINTYWDQGFRICHTCAQQVIRAYSKLKNNYKDYLDTLESEENKED